jgi:hypothetical protein
MAKALASGLRAWRVERLGGHAHWSAPVVLLAHLDAPVAGGLLAEGNLRVEGWAFWIDGDGQVRPAQLELHGQGERLRCQAIPVARHDVVTSHGLEPSTPPLGFRFLLDGSWSGPELQVVVRVAEGECTLARLQLTAVDADLQRGLDEAIRAAHQADGPAGLGWPWLLGELGRGRCWDGSEVAGPERLQQELARDLRVMRQVLAPCGDASAAAHTAAAVLTVLAQRYGLTLLDALMARVNQLWLAPRQLEFTRHGLQRTFRFWSQQEKQRAMAITTEALQRWHAAGIPCFHTFGTLLGLVREGNLLNHDDDIDAVAVVPVAADETPEQALAALEQRLNALGHRTAGAYRFHRHVEHRGFWFDLFVATTGGEAVTFWGTKIWTTTLEQLLPVQSADLEGLSCVLPRDAEHVVEGIYGSGWRTPRPYHYTGIQRALGSGSHSAARIRAIESQQH